MIIKNLFCLFMVHTLMINSMDLRTSSIQEEQNGAEKAELSLSSSHPAYGTVEMAVDMDAATSIDFDAEGSGEPIAHSVKLSLDLKDAEIKELEKDEIKFLAKACKFNKFTKYSGVSESRAERVIKNNYDHPKIQQIVSAMRTRQINPKEVVIDKKEGAVKSRGIDVGIDMKDIHEVSYDLAGLLWKEDRVCCGHTISQKMGQKVTSYGLTALTVSALMAYNIFLIVSNYENGDPVINNYYYNCTNP